MMRALDFPTHPLSPLPSHLPGIRSRLLLLFASADPQIPISRPALSKIPRSDVWPMDASKDHAQVRSSPIPTSRPLPLYPPGALPPPPLFVSVQPRIDRCPAHLLDISGIHTLMSIPL